MLAILIEVPEGSNIMEVDGNGNFLHPDVVALLADLKAAWPASLAPGTHPVGGRQITQAALAYIDDPVTAINALIALYGLDWQLRWCQSFFADPETGLPTVYLNGRTEVTPFLNPFVDDLGNPIGGHYEPSVYAGQAPWV